MNNKILYLAAMLLMVVGVSSCDDNWERPPLVIPEATMQANTTIAQLKAMYYDGATNSCEQIGTNAAGEEMIIQGVAISSDASGNIFKTLYIADQTGAIAIRLDAYDLYQSFQYGQKVVVKVTGLYIGCYGGLLQIGWTASNGTPSRIPADVIATNFEVDGLADVGAIAPRATTIAELNQVLKTPQAIDWQCELVSISGVHFEDAGKLAFVQSGSNNTSRYLLDDEGNKIIVYSSSYGDFAKYLLPEGTGTVTAILSYFNKSGWQLILNSTADLEGFGPLIEANGGNNTGGDLGQGDGTEANPYNVAAVLGGATGSGVWVKGYIVGWVDGMSLSEGATFNSNATAATNLLIADGPDCTDASLCVPVQLPSGALRNALNLKDNPGNYKKELEICGSLETYFSSPGIKSPTDYKIAGASPSDGETVYTGLVDNMDGWTIANVTLPAGIENIWTWKVYNDSGYLNGSAYSSDGSSDSQAYAYTTVDLAGYTSASLTYDQAAKFQTTLKDLCGPVVRISGTEAWTKLSVPNWCEAGSWTFVSSGKISLNDFAGKKIDIGFVYGSSSAGADTWEIKNFNVSAAK